MKSSDALKSAMVNLENPELSTLERNRAMGRFFNHYRDTLGLSAEHVAREIGVDAEILLAYEAGSKSASLDEIIHLTILLNIPPEEVLKIITDLYTKLDV